MSAAARTVGRRIVGVSARHVAQAALLVALALLAAAPARAHRLAPSFLGVDERAPGEVALRWKTPTQVARGAVPEPFWHGCTRTGAPSAETTPDALVVHETLACPPGLAGVRVGVHGLAASGTDALVQVVRADGARLTRVLTAADPEWELPRRPPRYGVLRDTAAMGVRHLAAGVDHLLFLLGLVALLGAGRRLLQAVSAFTLGHATTLGLAAGAGLTLPPAPVELGIAISLVVLGCELAAPTRAAPGWLRRRPGRAPFAFGLLHGLGFAGALRAAGLPASDVPAALVGFHAGLELAQLGAVALFLIAAAALRPLARQVPRPLAPLPATLVGAVGVWLALSRALAWAGLPLAGVLTGAR